MRYTVWILAILLVTHPVDAQEKDSCYSGVYVTADDFVHNDLSYQINTGVKGNKLEFSFPADITLTVRIITPDTTFKFAPGSIYGFNDCGNIFRYFVGGKELDAQEDYYKIEEVADLIIYSSAFISGDETFYSTGFTSPIHRLTLKNLKKDFNDHSEFMSAAAKLKRLPGDGLATRNENGDFLINQIYRETIKTK